jgi:hypothetical protein
MATSALTVTISSGSNTGERRFQERAQMKELLELVVQAIGDGVSTSGTIRDRSGQNAGSWSWTAGASS